MKTEEDEAFDELARKQGMWGGGFPAKRQAAMDKINSHFDEAYKKMHEDRAKYGTSWSKNGERIDPASVYFEEPAQKPVAWITPDGEGFRIRFSEPTNDVPFGWDALYTTPPAQEPDALTDALTIAYQSGYSDGKKAALATREWNFCERCGKRTKDMFTIHTCTPPQGDA